MASDAALLVNLIGFTVGTALYATLAVTVLTHRSKPKVAGVDLLLMTTAALGLLWNLGELYSFIQKDFAAGAVSPWVSAIAFSALGFLPSVVVHSAQQDEDRAPWLKYAAYTVSSIAACLHFYAAVIGMRVPSELALEAQTIGAIALAGGMLFFYLRQALEKKMVWASTLLIFAVSALHLSGDREGASWVIELVAHQASLPLALAILYQNYKFAFADLFLKRAISLMLLSLTAFVLYAAVAAPLLKYHETHDRDDASAVSLILTLWIATALAYPLIYRFALWLVNTVILRRVDYAMLRDEIAAETASLDSPADILDHVSARLAAVLTARNTRWSPTFVREAELASVELGFGPNDARIFVPTVESPFFELRFGEFAGGRRLLSDEVATLEAISLIAARRIDAVRVSTERYQQSLREMDLAKLAAEAQLTALRSQINPHFLFNSLTTIGYLITAEPQKASDTLLRLTQLLRSVLSSQSASCTLGEEIELIRSYLDIERARFEERLNVEINVPQELMSMLIPPLILQPLVENAVKHGISKDRDGGTVRITAEMIIRSGEKKLRLSVWDSGSGDEQISQDEYTGIGLANVRQRLATQYGGSSSVRFIPTAGKGTEVVIEIPAEDQIAPPGAQAEVSSRGRMK